MSYRTIMLLTLLGFFLPLQWVNAKEPPIAAVPMINLTVGKVGVFDDEFKADRVGIEYRFRPFGKWDLIPAIGYAFSENDDSFFYADLRYDYWLNNRWVLIPSLGAGVFTNGTKLDLGNDIEFRSGLEIAYRFNTNYRIGVALFHLSNAGISNNNPGTEALVLSLSIPLKDN